MVGLLDFSGENHVFWSACFHGFGLEFVWVVFWAFFSLVCPLNFFSFSFIFFVCLFLFSFEGNFKKGDRKRNRERGLEDVEMREEQGEGGARR